MIRFFYIKESHIELAVVKVHSFASKAMYFKMNYFIFFAFALGFAFALSKDYTGFKASNKMNNHDH